MRFGRRATWGAVGLALGLACSGLAVLAVPASPPSDFMGHPLVAPVSIAPAGPTFEVRHNCRIARFGVAPWQPQGTARDAQWEQMTRLWLASVGMPQGGHDGAIAALRGASAGQVDLGNTSGAFDTTYRVGDRYVSCLQSQTRFTSDTQTEPAWSYPYSYGGREWRLVIIKRCGNVTLMPPGVVAPVLLAIPAPAAAPPVSAMGPVMPHGGPGVYYQPPPLPAVGFPLPGGPVRDVPEPGSLALMIAALGALLCKKR
jgi:hypothetical protein